MSAVCFLEVLVFGEKLHVLLLVHFGVHDYLSPLDTSIDPFTCSVAFEPPS